MSEVLDETYEALLFFYGDDLLIDFIDKYNIDLNISAKDKESVFRVDETPQLLNAIHSIVPYFENPQQEDKNIIKLKFEEAFLNILHSSSSSAFRSFLSLIYTTDNSFKSKVEHEYMSFDSIGDMANSFKMNELSFRKKFKTIFKTTPKKWLLSKRLQKAKMLLQNSSLNVTQVCSETGFDNLSWFTQTFKKEFGQTPKEIKTNKI